MTEKPSAIKTLWGAKSFIQENFSHLWEMLKPLLPYILIFEALAFIVGQYYEAGQFFSLPTMYFLACFALAWHRSVLQGVSSQNAVHPFELKTEDKPFLWVFFGLIIIPFIIGILVGVLGGLLATLGEVVAAVVAVGFLIGFVIAIIELIRLSFMLPGKAVGAEMNMDRARQISKGLVFKIFLAGLIVGILYGILTVIFSLTMGFVAGIVFGILGTESLIFNILLFAVMTPLIFAQVIFTALNVTILSKYYQWGVENNL